MEAIIGSEQSAVYGALGLALLTVALLLTLWVRSRNKLSRLIARFRGVVDADAELAKVREEQTMVEKDTELLRASYREKKDIHDRLADQVAIFDEQLSFAEYGVYEPHFDFGDSEKFKEAIKAVRSQQKDIVSSKNAVHVMTEWQVEGSASKGRTMANRAVRLALRAFNAESDAAIANVRWNNAEAMVRRIENARTQIDKANASLNLEISEKYLALKLKELRLTHEYRERLKVERDERAEEARLKREEQRLLKEAADAEKEERKYADLLEKVRSEVGASEHGSHARRIAELEQQLAVAHEKAERAKAMAEQTQTGFVYVISNVGSFGEGIVKIGLTRRLNPDDRVRELGDASVPFTFDTHAMIYSETAPALELALHRHFEERRVNDVNMRKEFFRASLEEVEEAVKSVAPDAEFHQDVEAQEFRETIAKREKALTASVEQKIRDFPAEI